MQKSMLQTIIVCATMERRQNVNMHQYQYTTLNIVVVRMRATFCCTHAPKDTQCACFAPGMGNCQCCACALLLDARYCLLVRLCVGIICMVEHVEGQVKSLSFTDSKMLHPHVHCYTHTYMECWCWCVVDDNNNNNNL